MPERWLSLLRTGGSQTPEPVLNLHRNIHGLDIFVDSQLRGLAFFGLLEDVVDALQKDVDLIDTRQISDQSEIYQEIHQIKESNCSRI